MPQNPAYTRIQIYGAPGSTRAREQWLRERKNGLGGSDVAAVLGLSPWKSAYDLWMEKTGRVADPDISEKASVEWGTILEAEIAKKFAKEHPEYKVTRVNAILKSKKHPWLLASLDRRIKDTNDEFGVLEIKTASMYAADAWKDNVPEYYKAQLAHYLLTTNYKYAIVAVLIGGQDYREYFFTRADLQYLMDRIENECKDFWYNYILSDIKPDMTGLDSESTTLLNAFPVNKGSGLTKIVGSAPAINTLVNKYNDLSEQLKIIEKEKKAVANEIKNYIGSREGIETNDFAITWTRGTRSTFDKAKFEEDHPGMLKDYYYDSPVNGSIKIKTK